MADRVSEAERVRTEAELRLAEHDQTLALAVAAAQKKQAAAFEVTLEKLKAEATRHEQVGMRSFAPRPAESQAPRLLHPRHPRPSARHALGPKGHHDAIMTPS